MVLITFIIIWRFDLNKLEEQKSVTNFEECAALGQPTMESYPRQCRYNNQTFAENIGNELAKINLIKINNPRPNQKVGSPLTITGEARGNWFFEASFPIKIYDADKNLLGIGIAQAQGEWLTTDFVPFLATLEFTLSQTPTGLLILEKDNPSGLAEYDDRLAVPISF